MRLLGQIAIQHTHDGTFEINSENRGEKAAPSLKNRGEKAAPSLKNRGEKAAPSLSQNQVKRLTGVIQ